MIASAKLVPSIAIKPRVPNHNNALLPNAHPLVSSLLLGQTSPRASSVLTKIVPAESVAPRLPASQHATPEAVSVCHVIPIRATREQPQHQYERHSHNRAKPVTRQSTREARLLDSIQLLTLCFGVR